jgi:hypothetical protein
MPQAAAKVWNTGDVGDLLNGNVAVWHEGWVPFDPIGNPAHAWAVET